MRIADLIESRVVSPILTFIYPPICLACNADLLIGEHLVCDGCWQSVEMVYSGDETYQKFISKFALDGVVSRVISPFYFEKDGKLQSIIHALKYEGFTSLGTKAGHLVGQLIRADNELSKSDFLVAVPLHPLKQRERGYNQSEFICRGIQEVTKIPTHSDVLKRRKYTVSQTQLSIEERRENVGDAFGVNERRRLEISGRAFILIDDVITTGSTIIACARELKNAGAKQVYAAAVGLAK